MKKSVIKTLSVFLALALVLPIVSMAVFADGTDDGVAPCKSCTHVYRTTFDTRYDQYSDEYHLCVELEENVCSLCGFTTYIETGSTWLGTHQFGSDSSGDSSDCCELCGYQK